MIARRRLIVGNWKMSGNHAQLTELDAIDATARAHPDVDIALCLPFTMIERAAARRSALSIGAQDCHAGLGGAHTGDISADMLRESGASWVIVGHSERRTAYGESDAMVRAKAEAAIEAGLNVLVCVGENASERRAGEAEQVVTAQLEQSFPWNKGARTPAVAYEPVWAIGTELAAATEQVAAMHRAIRKLLDDREVRLVYGGSVSPANAGDLLVLPEVDGLLVGRASLTASDFIPIVEAAARTRVP